MMRSFKPSPAQPTRSKEHLGRSNLSANRLGHRMGRIALLGLILALLFGLASWSSDYPLTSRVFAKPLLDDRQVCSLLDLATGNNAHITGQDGGESIEAEGKVFWTFGDTLVDFGYGIINTNAAYTTDFNAADCIALTHKTDDLGRAKPLMSVDREVNDDECLVWPAGMAQVQPGYIHTFYISVERCNDGAPGYFEVGAIGLAKFDTDTNSLITERIGGLIWDNDTLPPGASPVSNPMTMVYGGNVYIFIDLRVARVPATADQLEDPTNYLYWNEDVQDWVPNFADATDLWTPQSPINGISVRYNNYLRQFLAVYTTGTPDFPLTLVAARTAPSIEGPWGPEFVLVNCQDYFPRSNLTCYTGIQHDEYEKDDGQTIYVTHANDEDYRLFLYEITFDVENQEQMIDTSSSAVQTVYQQGVPHTDKLGNVRTTYSAQDSFFPNAIYLPSDESRDAGVVPVLSNAGFNSAILEKGTSVSFFTSQIDGNNTYTVVVDEVGELSPDLVTVTTNSTNITITDSQLVSGSTYQYVVCIPNCGTGMRVTSGTVVASGNTVSLSWDNGSAFKLIINQDLEEDANFNSDPSSFDDSLFQTYKNDPRVFGWWMDNEPLNRAVVRGIDPQPNYDANDQVYQTYKGQTSQAFFITESVGPISNPLWDDFVNLGDAASIYYYPKFATLEPPPNLPLQSLQEVADFTQSMVAAVNQVKPAWYTPQAWSGGLWKYPTPEEERAQVYAAIVHGATGIFHFTWDNCDLRYFQADPTYSLAGLRPNLQSAMPNCPNGLTLSTDELNQGRALWDALDATQDGINKELQTLEPIILSPTSAIDYEVFVNAAPISGSPVRTMLKEFDDDLYLLAVNIDNTTVNVKVRFPVEIVGADVLFEEVEDGPQAGEQRKAFVFDNELRDTFAPFAVHVYRITRPYTVHHQVPFRQTETYSSAATAEMIIDFMNQSVQVQSIIDLTQNSIYDYGIERNLSTNPTGELDPKGMDAVLGHFDPYDILIDSSNISQDALVDGNPWEGYNFVVQTYTDINTYMRDIAHWMDYPVPTYAGSPTLTNPDRIPPAVPMYGKYNQWMVVNGFSASADPLPDPSNPFFTPDFTLFGFWLTDPNTGGLGASRFVSAWEAANTYFKPVVASDSYFGKFVQVAEPPPVESDAEILIAEEEPTEAAQDAGGSGSSAATASPLSAASITTLQVNDVNWDVVIPDYVLSDPAFGGAYEGSVPAAAVVVQRPDGGDDYHIVTFEKAGLTSAAVIVTEEDGAFREATWAGVPLEYDWLTEAEALALLEDGGFISPGDFVWADFVWEPGAVSSSPFQPYWRIAVDGGTLYVKSDGSVVGDADVVERPAARIDSPAELSEFVEGLPVSLQGSAQDPQDGSIGSSLQWTVRPENTLATDVGTASSLGTLDASLVYHPQFIVEVRLGKTARCEGTACFASSSVAGLTLSGLEAGRQYKVAVCVPTGCQDGELSYYIGNADGAGRLAATFPAYPAQLMAEIWVVKTSGCTGLGCFASSSIEGVSLSNVDAGRQYRVSICPQAGCVSGAEVQLGSGENVTASGLAAGAQIISATVTDSDGNTDLREIHIRVLGRPAELSVQPLSSSQATFSWSPVIDAASYELCSAGHPNPGGAWTCENVGHVTSVDRATPTTISKTVLYYAVRAVGSSGVKGKFSNRGAITVMNETISGVTYNSYHVLYKDASDTKYVNGFNRHGSASRRLAFSNTNATLNMTGLVAANATWFGTASAWTAPDWNTIYGPLVQAIESPYFALSPNDFQWVSTWCMGSELTQYCE